MRHSHFRDLESRDLCVQYEFLKRNSFDDVHRNICEMITSKKGFSRRRSVPARDGKNPSKLVEVRRSMPMIFEEIPKPRKSTEDDSDVEEPVDTQYQDQSGANFTLKDLADAWDRTLIKKYPGIKHEADKNIRNWKKDLIRIPEEEKKNWKEDLVEDPEVIRTFNFRNFGAEFCELTNNTKCYIKKMKIVVDYGKIKIQMKNRDIVDVIDVDYWRCDQGTTLVWHGYFARFDSSRKFQQLAAYNVFHTIKWTYLHSLEFETEKYNSWNPKVDPFYKFYKQLSHRLRFQIKVKEFKMELSSYDGQDATEDQVMDILKYMDPSILKKITIRKWDDSHMHTNGKARVMKSWRMVPRLKQWRKAEDFDILDRNIQMLKEDYIGEKHVRTVRVGLKEEDIYELCRVVRQRRSTPFNNLTMTVNENFDFSKAQRLLVEKRDIELVDPIIIDGKPVKISYRLGQLKCDKSAWIMMSFEETELEGKKEKRIIFGVKVIKEKSKFNN